MRYRLLVHTMTEMLRSGSVMTRAAMGRAHTTAFGLSCFAFVAALATRFASEPPGFRMWPTWACPREHGGAGWEARIEQHRTTSVAGVDVDEVRVVFVNGRRPFQPMWLQLRALRPL